MIDKNAISSRIDKISGDNKSEFARKCGMSDQSFRCLLPKKSVNDKRTPSMPGPEKLIQIASAAGVSIEWILTGTEKSHRNKDITTIEHERIINNFEDKECAKEINANLVEIERLSPDMFKEAETLIRGMVMVLKAQEKKSGTTGE